MKRKTRQHVTKHSKSLFDSARAAFILTAIIGIFLFLGYVVRNQSASALDAAADVTVSAAISPNTNSGSWPVWSSNAIKAIQSGATTMGDSSLPSYYKEILPTDIVTSSMVISSPFNSWLGKSDPATVFGGSFSYEKGNTLRFVYMLKAKPGTKIDVANGVVFSILPNSWKPNGLGPFTYHEYVSTLPQPNVLVGVDYGADGEYGGGDDTLFTSGTGPVDAIIGTFTTSAELSTAASTTPQNPNEQEALDRAINETETVGYVSNIFQIAYSSDPAVQVSGNIGVEPTPTPTTIPTPTDVVLPTVTILPTPVVLPVKIDIRPSSYKNIINLKSRGLLGVAILSSSTLNPKNVDSDTVLFAGAPPVRVNMRDVNRDRVKDMVMYFKIRQLQLDNSSTSGMLVGKLKNGTAISGTDSVTIVPKIHEVDEEDLED
ncbi:MAG: hypothetical protein WC775_04085 [Patescibacteria group bacterium]|jgi:hypothetical protein